MLSSPQSQAAATPKPPSEKKMAAATKFLNLHFNADMIETLAKSLAKSIRDSIYQDTRQTMSAEIEKSLIADLNEIVNKIFMLDTSKEKFLRHLVEVFEEDEIEAFLEFYESPLGKKILAKMVIYTGSMAELTKNILDENNKQLEEAFKKAIDATMKNANPILLMFAHAQQITTEMRMPPPGAPSEAASSAAKSVALPEAATTTTVSVPESEYESESDAIERGAHIKRKRG